MKEIAGWLNISIAAVSGRKYQAHYKIIPDCDGSLIAGNKNSFTALFKNYR